ncbi:MAG: FUSC family protein [Devosia sp.]|uniref:FUSC family protein n=1 Tax=Devosia sp. TaxID=1871048 RepID=UPI0033993742
MTRRRDAMRHLLASMRLADILAFAQQPSLRNAALAGLQASVAIAVAIPLAFASPWPHLVGFAALGALAALFGRFAPEKGRGQIVLWAAICQTSGVGVMSLVVWLGASPELQLALLALLSGVFFFISATGRFGPPGALIFIFAAGAAMGTVDGWQVVVERVAATGGVAILAWQICLATEIFRHKATEERPLPVEPARPLSHRLTAATRIAVGAGIAALVTHAMGAAHPAWAAMGAVAVIQGSHLHISMNRALQRMMGTVIGALAVWLVLQLDPSVTMVVVLLIGLQFATEVVIGANYGLGQVLVTPMALLMSHLAAPQAGAGIAPERVFDTLVGVSIGMVIAVLLSTLDDRTYLAEHRATRKRA